MSRPRSGIGFELASILLVLSCLAGSMTLVIAIHRRTATRTPDRVAVAVAPPAPVPKPVKPLPVPVIVEPVEPEPVPGPPPVDPTPAVLSVLTSHEADQRLEALKADRRTAALEAARREAILESERLRRRESLVHAQLSSLDGKVRKLETEAEELAFERDALLKERDARKAMAARARSRPAQAILPHKGPNGTWRRPIVIECRDGMAILQPQGTSFGLMELEDAGFGPMSNAFTATVAREAIRIQGKSTPDGKPVVPYIFFVVRPDGIRPYYEARGRLEALGITFGYELADQDWQIDIPDLDDTASWDGSTPYRPTGEDPMAAMPPSASPGGGRSRDDDEFPTFAPVRGTADGNGGGRGKRGDGDFAWPAAAPYLRGLEQRGRPSQTGLADRNATPAGVGGVDPLAGMPDLGPIGDSPAGTSGGTGRGGPARPGPYGVSPGQVPAGGKTRGSGPDETAAKGLADRILSEGSRLAGPVPAEPGLRSQDGSEPGADFVWNGKHSAAGKPGRDGKAQDLSTPMAQAGMSDVPDRSDSKPSQGSPTFDPSSTPGGPITGSPETDPTQPGGSGSPSEGQSRASSDSTSRTSNAPKTQGQGQGKTPQRVIGPGTAPPSTMTPPPGMTGLAVGSPPPVLPSPGMPMPAMPEVSANLSKPRAVLPELPANRIVDRTFEIVVVCGPRGVIVQPGGYRVTAAALQDRDGLLKKQVVALIKARRSADPKVILEPSVRFLVQSGGFETYRSAKGQYLVSGLDYPVSTQVAEPDPVSILPSEGW